LGSIRAAVSDSGKAATVIGYDDYDPWGYPLATRTKAIPNAYLQGASKNKFTGKERDEDFGLNWDYFGGRTYDWLIGRWPAVDPLWFKHPDVSPYVYVLNNPLLYIDPDGQQVRYHRVVQAPLTTTEIKQNFAQRVEQSKEYASGGVYTMAAGTLAFGALEAVGSALASLDPFGISSFANPILMAESVVARGATVADDAVGAATKVVSTIGEAAAKQTANEGIVLSNLGRASKSEGIREVIGNASDARALFDQLRGGNAVKEVKPGVFVAESATKPGAKVTFRAASKSGPPTVDVHGIEEGVRKVKFVHE